MPSGMQVPVGGACESPPLMRSWMRHACRTADRHEKQCPPGRRASPAPRACGVSWCPLLVVMRYREGRPGSRVASLRRVRRTSEIDWICNLFSAAPSLFFFIAWPSVRFLRPSPGGALACLNSRGRGVVPRARSCFFHPRGSVAQRQWARLPGSYFVGAKHWVRSAWLLVVLRPSGG